MFCCSVKVQARSVQSCETLLEKPKLNKKRAGKVWSRSAERKENAHHEWNRWDGKHARHYSERKHQRAKEQGCVVGSCSKNHRNSQDFDWGPNSCSECGCHGGHIITHLDMFEPKQCEKTNEFLQMFPTIDNDDRIKQKNNMIGHHWPSVINYLAKHLCASLIFIYSFQISRFPHHFC